MKLNFQQKFNVVMMSILIIAVVAITLFSERPASSSARKFVNPITKTDSTFAVTVPEP